MTWVAVAIAVGTAVVGGYEQHQVAKKQDNQLAAQLRQQYATKQKAAQRTSQLIQNQAGQTDKPQETAAAKQYQTALSANQTQAQAPLATVGAVSDAYKKAGSDAALGISNYGTQRGNLTAAIDAPGQQRQDNRKNLDDYQLDLNNLNRGQQGQDFLSSLKLNSIRANPWIGLLTSAGRAYAGAKLGSANSGSAFSGANAGGSAGFDPWSGASAGAYGG